MTSDRSAQSLSPANWWLQLNHLLGLIRFSHTVFALPFALLSSILAWQVAPFHWQHLLGILLCMVFARSAAMAFNRLADRKIDADNPRTAGRHIPAGLLSVGTVIVFTVACIVGFVAATLLFLPNPWPLRLSLPVLLFLLGYSYAKRWTSLCHYWLSAALMLSPIAAWIAITGTVSAAPLWLAVMIFFWVGGFDILYATQDAQFDRDAQLYSIPSLLGIRRALQVAFLSHIVTILCLFAFWKVSGLGVIFLVGCVIVSLLLIYEHSLVRETDLSRVNLAFFNVNSVISIGLLLLACIDLAVFGTTKFP